MKTPVTICCTLMLAFAAGASSAQDAMKKDDAMGKKEMTMKECQDHMAMSKKEGMKKDDAMMKKDAACDQMMKKDKMMKKDGAASEPMKK